jgi:hypothetical protein
VRTLPLLLALAACGDAPPAGPPPADDDAADTEPAAAADTEVVAPTRVFAFVVLADPHVVAEGDRTERLRDALAWIEANKEGRDLELVLLAGDLAWADGFGPFLSAMEDLTLPWVPITGDNEVQSGFEQAYDEAFTGQYAALAATLEGWSRLPTPVHHPDIGADAWLQCFSFRWRGVTFVGVDLSARVIDPLLGEFADLHDFPGGTLPFLADRLAELPADGPREDVVVLTHNPMLWTAGGLNPDEQARLNEVVEPYGDRVALALGGHLHFDLDEPCPEGASYGVHLTDAVWDDDVRLRVVEVWSDGETFTYVQEGVTVPR